MTAMARKVHGAVIEATNSCLIRTKLGSCHLWTAGIHHRFFSLLLAPFLKAPVLEQSCKNQCEVRKESGNQSPQSKWNGKSRDKYLSKNNTVDGHSCPVRLSRDSRRCEPKAGRARVPILQITVLFLDEFEGAQSVDSCRSGQWCGS